MIGDALDSNERGCHLCLPRYRRAEHIADNAAAGAMRPGWTFWTPALIRDVLRSDWVAPPCLFFLCRSPERATYLVPLLRRRQPCARRMPERRSVPAKVHGPLAVATLRAKIIRSRRATPARSQAPRWLVLL